MKNIFVWMAILPFLFLGCKPKPTYKDYINTLDTSKMKEVCWINQQMFNRTECQGWIYPNTSFTRKGGRDKMESVHLGKCVGGIRRNGVRVAKLSAFNIRYYPCTWTRGGSYSNSITE